MKKLEDYLEAPYRIVLRPIPGEPVEWMAEYPDLPGCVGAGDTAEEAISEVRESLKALVMHNLEKNIAIAEPKNPETENYSGFLTLRIPKSLHMKLAEVAQEENTSLNQYLLYLLTERNTARQIRSVTYHFNVEFPKPNKTTSNEQLIAKKLFGWNPPKSLVASYDVVTKRQVVLKGCEC